MDTSNPKEAWTLKEAKAHLAQVLRLAEVEGPQYICVDRANEQDVEKQHKAFVVVPAEVWQENNAPGKQTRSKHLGKWLVENTPRGVGIKEPEYDGDGRFIAFSDVVFDDEE